jgi:hypothetical protein
MKRTIELEKDAPLLDFMDVSFKPSRVFGAGFADVDDICDDYARSFLCKTSDFKSTAKVT